MIVTVLAIVATAVIVVLVIWINVVLFRAMFGRHK